jgi:hypothetical protein
MAKIRVRARQSVKQFGRKEKSEVRRDRSMVGSRSGPLFALIGTQLTRILARLIGGALPMWRRRMT